MFPKNFEITPMRRKNSAASSTFLSPSTSRSAAHVRFTPSVSLIPNLRLESGEPYPLGCTYTGLGANFAIFSSVATELYLCLFDSIDDKAEVARLRLPRRTSNVWHGFLRGVLPGQLYGYRIQGPWDPENGHRCNIHKLCLDPYAKAIARNVRWHPSMYSYEMDHSSADLVMNTEDNAAYAPLAAVVEDAAFTWGSSTSSEDDARRERIKPHRMVIYETHVWHLTILHPLVPEHIRGTYLAVACEPIVRHLKSIGVTTIELMPIHCHVDEPWIVDRGQVNAWGYNTLSFFAPDPKFCTNANDPLRAVIEFKMMVRALHAAGIEVILDVVYNHTCEGNRLGPSTSFKLIDNAAYYRLDSKSRRYYYDLSGCGNSLNTSHPRAMQLILDSLRYWVEVMHVDGFRFDLASALMRDKDPRSIDFMLAEVINQDPVLSKGIKFIAEPWDCTDNGYLVGQFPAPWAEWNGRYRDTVRRFWNAHCPLSELSARLAGSADMYTAVGPYASVNFVTAHDGFTLHDLVSYDKKRNDENGENNNDGDNHNISWGCGIDGPTDDPMVNELRARQKRNIFATLALSIGTMMIRGGDELSHSQGGNNNSYCLDELNYYDWSAAFAEQWAEDDTELLDTNESSFLEFVRTVMRIRTRNPSLQCRSHYLKHVWLNPAGHEMQVGEWADQSARCVGILIPRGDPSQQTAATSADGGGGTSTAAGGGGSDWLPGTSYSYLKQQQRQRQQQQAEGDTLLVLINSFWEPVKFVMPDARYSLLSSQHPVQQQQQQAFQTVLSNLRKIHSTDSVVSSTSAASASSAPGSAGSGTAALPYSSSGAADAAGNAAWTEGGSASASGSTSAAALASQTVTVTAPSSVSDLQPPAVDGMELKRSVSKPDMYPGSRSFIYGLSSGHLGTTHRPSLSLAPLVGWVRILDTAMPDELGDVVPGGSGFSIPARTLLVFALHVERRRKVVAPIDDILSKYAIQSPFLAQQMMQPREQPQEAARQWEFGRQIRQPEADRIEDERRHSIVLDREPSLK